MHLQNSRHIKGTMTDADIKEKYVTFILWLGIQNNVRNLI